MIEFKKVDRVGLWGVGKELENCVGKGRPDLRESLRLGG